MWPIIAWAAAAATTRGGHGATPAPAPTADDPLAVSDDGENVQVSAGDDDDSYTTGESFAAALFGC